MQIIISRHRLSATLTFVFWLQLFHMSNFPLDVTRRLLCWTLSSRRQRVEEAFYKFRHYMRMLMEMLLFIKAVRTGDWELHLLSLEVFAK